MPGHLPYATLRVSASCKVACDLATSRSHVRRTLPSPRSSAGTCPYGIVAFISANWSFVRRTSSISTWPTAAHSRIASAFPGILK
jgi:hypothetical protein